MLFFQRLQFAEQAVIFAVADLRVIQRVVAVIVVVQRLAQLVQLLLQQVDAQADGLRVGEVEALRALRRGRLGKGTEETGPVTTFSIAPKGA